MRPDRALVQASPRGAGSSQHSQGLFMSRGPQRDSQAVATASARLLRDASRPHPGQRLLHWASSQPPSAPGHTEDAAGQSAATPRAAPATETIKSQGPITGQSRLPPVRAAHPPQEARGEGRPILPPPLPSGRSRTFLLGPKADRRQGRHYHPAGPARSRERRSTPPSWPWRRMFHCADPPSSGLVSGGQGARQMFRMGAPGQDSIGFFWRMMEGSRALSECDRHLDARSHTPVKSILNQIWKMSLSESLLLLQGQPNWHLDPGAALGKCRTVVPSQMNKSYKNTSMNYQTKY
ncbi:hypothetical protein NDU88_007506 [Pleurodeles waltl]|uniref:Uncharacterized protein n=1 Tax=Pleurodeles waltl TaxID=8319 RepID=A0AAV7RS43_PLEWA|nr:hypothetical protein NDU88_007506 [Pleurodeles waltl]